MKTKHNYFLVLISSDEILKLRYFFENLKPSARIEVFLIIRGGRMESRGAGGEGERPPGAQRKGGRTTGGYGTNAL